MARKSAKFIPPSDGRPQRVRVRLQRINCNLAKAHPADGDGKLWWAQLKKALGTSSSAFVNASLVQLQGAARLPGGGISEIAVNAALAIIEAAAPRDEIEAALAVQMAATHSAAMTVLERLGGSHGGERRVAALGSAAARLLRAYTHTRSRLYGGCVMEESSSFESNGSTSTTEGRPSLATSGRVQREKANNLAGVQTRSQR
jgi:hypothetical protein